jgi:hypothetical protein
VQRYTFSQRSQVRAGKGGAGLPPHVPSPPPPAALETDIAEWVDHVGVSSAVAMPGVVVAAFGGDGSAVDAPGSPAALPDARVPTKPRGTDFDFIEHTLGKAKYKQLRDAGYSFSYDKRPVPYGSYIAVFYPDYASGSVPGKRARPMMVECSRVKVANETDHGRAIVHCYNSFILPSLAMDGMLPESAAVAGPSADSADEVSAGGCESDSGASSGELDGIV